MRGLVLEGGGIKGSYQIGAFYAFRDCGIKFDGYVGTSIGSFNAAALACNRHKELLDLWYNVDLSKVLGLDEKFINDYNEKGGFGTFLEAVGEIGGVVKNKGLDYKGLMETAHELIKYDELKKSKSDFGLVTVKVTRKGFKPQYVYKEHIRNQDELIEYIMASCYFPGIKQRRMIDNHFYLDGGFYDNSPVRMLIDRNYNELYVINVRGIGLNRKYNDNGAKIINIKPSRRNGLIFELNRSVIRDKIMMGYYDTLRVLKKLDGYKYCFKPRDKGYYRFVTRNIDRRLIKRVMNYFNTKSIKTACIKAVEYILEKNEVSYYDVYNLTRLCKKYRKINDNHFVYQFIKGLRFFF